jgi:TonB-linked SusC/RagA family outer membrane protein
LVTLTLITNMLKFLLNKVHKQSVIQKITAVLFVFMACTSAMAQYTVSGKVTSGEDQSPIPGANILVKGTTNGTISDADGNFSVNANSANDVLVFSFVGFTTQEVAISNRTSFNVVLESDAKQLSEVVVTALGIEKEAARLGYAVQKVSGNDLLKAREPNPLNSLIGKVAGLNVAPSAELLGAPQVLIRSTNPNERPLYVVDGVPINSDSWNISADDIESYTVLKGPSAAALYGSRSQFGAIIITTKKGSRDQRGFSVEFNSSYMVEKGFIAIPKVQDLYGPGDHGVYAYEDGKGSGLNDGDYDIWGPKFEGQLIPQYDSPIDPSKTYTTTFPSGSTFTSNRVPTPWVARGKDNLNRFIEAGIVNTNNLSISSSNDKYSLRFSTSYNYQKGIVPNTDLNTNNFNISASYNFSPKLKLETVLNYNRQSTKNIPDVNYGPNSMIYNITIWGGADWDIDQLKNYWEPGKEGVQQLYAEHQRYNNPWFLTKEWLRGHYKNDVYGYLTLSYKINDFLDLKARSSITTNTTFRNEKFPYSATVYGREQAQGDYREDNRQLFENNTELLLSVNKNITPNFNVSGLIGGNLRTFDYNSSYVTTNYLNVPGVYNFSNTQNPLIASNYSAPMQVLSGYYSFDFSYRNFVTLSTTGRVDKSSTLPQNSNTFFYPSASLSTVVSDYVKLPEVISFFKVRASYSNVKSALTQPYIGTTPGGSNPIGYGSTYQSAYDGPSYTNSAPYETPIVYNSQVGARASDKIIDPNLSSSSRSSYEAGLDMRFLENRIVFDATYFNYLDGPQVFDADIPESTGYNKKVINGGKTERSGFEMSITGSPLRNSQGLNWDVTANWSTWKETWNELPGTSDVYNNFFRKGDRTDKYYDQALVHTPDGRLINDAGGRPIISPVNQFLGNQNPDWTWGLNNKFSYKNFTFSFQFDGRVGGVIANYIQRQTFRGGRHIETIEGAMGIARDQDYRGVKSWVGPGVVVSNGTNIEYDPNTGAVTNYGALEYGENTTKTYLQDWISRYYRTAEANIQTKTYMKLREVVIGYNLPSSLLQKTFIRKASISLVGRNLLYFAAKDDIDIDQYLTGGYSSLQTPTTRRYGVNINLIF